MPGTPNCDHFHSSSDPFEVDTTPNGLRAPSFISADEPSPFLPADSLIDFHLELYAS